MLFDTLTELDRLGRNLSSVAGGAISAPVDIHRDGDRYVVDADLPGVDPSSVEVTLEGQALTIRAERSEASTTKDAQWVVHERGFGAACGGSRWARTSTPTASRPTTATAY